MAGAEIMDIAYGIDVAPRDDPYIATAEHAVESISATTNAGSYLVDVLPVREYHDLMLPPPLTACPVKHLPEWFPGAHFQKEAKAWKVHILNMLHRPYDVVKARMVRCVIGQSFGSAPLTTCRPGEKSGTVLL